MKSKKSATKKTAVKHTKPNLKDAKAAVQAAVDYVDSSKKKPVTNSKESKMKNLKAGTVVTEAFNQDKLEVEVGPATLLRRGDKTRDTDSGENWVVHFEVDFPELEVERLVGKPGAFDFLVEDRQKSRRGKERSPVTVTEQPDGNMLVSCKAPNRAAKRRFPKAFKYERVEGGVLCHMTKASADKATPVKKAAKKAPAKKTTKKAVTAPKKGKVTKAPKGKSKPVKAAKADKKAKAKK